MAYICPLTCFTTSSMSSWKTSLMPMDTVWWFRPLLNLVPTRSIRSHAVRQLFVVCGCSLYSANFSSLHLLPMASVSFRRKYSIWGSNKEKVRKKKSNFVQQFWESPSPLRPRWLTGTDPLTGSWKCSRLWKHHRPRWRDVWSRYFSCSTGSNTSCWTPVCQTRPAPGNKKKKTDHSTQPQWNSSSEQHVYKC